MVGNGVVGAASGEDALGDVEDGAARTGEDVPAAQGADAPGDGTVAPAAASEGRAVPLWTMAAAR